MFINNTTPLLKFKKTSKLPVILQSEVAECGITCLAMISQYYGSNWCVPSLREQFPLTLKGSTFEDLVQCSREIGLIPRPLRLDLEELKDLTPPCILHWKMNHFVVLKKTTKTGIIIHDPLFGQKHISYLEANKHFTGVALEFQLSNKYKKKEKKPPFKINQLWTELGGVKKSFISIIFLSFFIQLLAVIAPFYTQIVIDQIITSNDKSFLNVIAMIFCLLMLVQALVSALRLSILAIASNQLSIQIGANLFHHLLKLPVSFFQKRHLGDVMSRFNSLEAIREHLTSTAVEVLVDGVMALTVLVMMYYYNAQLAAIVTLSVIIYALVRVLFYRPTKEATDETLVNEAHKDSIFMETSRAIQAIKMYGKEARRESDWQNAFANSLNSNFKVEKIKIKYTLTNQVIFGTENILIIYLGALAIMSGELTVGMLTAFIAYKSQFSQKANSFIDKVMELKLLRVHLDRIADIALCPLEKIDQKAPLLDLHGDIELKNISYSYGRNEDLVLQNLNLTINHGESIAIIGASGVGKSTLLKILAGLEKPSSGSVLIDGTDGTNQGVKMYNGKLGIVMQDDQLLSGTIADNITFFDTKRDSEHMEYCAKVAAIHKDIQNMPMQYHSLVGDMGSTLSGGQKQRLILARALYFKPKVLILDEATSHLDLTLERFINKGIKKLNITRIVVAHRPESILSAEKIYHLKGGTLTQISKQEYSKELEKNGRQ